MVSLAHRGTRVLNSFVRRGPWKINKEYQNWINSIGSEGRLDSVQSTAKKISNAEIVTTELHIKTQKREKFQDGRAILAGWFVVVASLQSWCYYIPSWHLAGDQFRKMQSFVNHLSSVKKAQWRRN